jgi:NUBPL iron-transfer P-loop NTPase
VGLENQQSRHRSVIPWPAYAVGLLDVDLCGPSAPRMVLGDAYVNASVTKSASEARTPVYSPTHPNLACMSISFLLQDPNAAVVWRGMWDSWSSLLCFTHQSYTRCEFRRRVGTRPFSLSPTCLKLYTSSSSLIGFFLRSIRPTHRPPKEWFDSTILDRSRLDGRYRWIGLFDRRYAHGPMFAKGQCSGGGHSRQDARRSVPF